MPRRIIARAAQYLPMSARTGYAIASRQRERDAAQQRELRDRHRMLEHRLDRLEDELASLRAGGSGKAGHGPADAAAAVDDIRRGARAASRAARESVWAAVYRDTVEGSDWLIGQALSPGRWAVGYPFLYVLYRVLDELRPTSILELGLGQSTKLTSRYAAHYEGVSHVVVEHDEGWVTAFGRNYVLPQATDMRRLDLELVQSPDGDSLLRYEGFHDAVGDVHYDLIVVDGPFGADSTRSREDILSLIPESLGTSFVILLDDFHRPAEKRTAAAISEALTNAGRAHSVGSYAGEKEMWVCVSEDLRFYTSL